MGTASQLLGKRFKYLEVIEFAGVNKYHQTLWICRCDCGNITKPIPATRLINGQTKSCGCALVRRTNLSHGCTGTRIHRIWKNMKYRCNSPSCKDFNHYGGRGITVCEEWKNNFQAFYDYVSKLPHFNEKGYSLDRINNDGNYEPNNVRWATRAEQNNNRRCVHKECGQVASA